MKPANILLFFLILYSLPASSTESVDCGNSVYWLQLHYNFSEDSFAGFSLYKDRVRLDIPSFNYEVLDSDFKNKSITFLSKGNERNINNIYLKVSGDVAELVINTTSYKVNCDWSAYEE
ncbi:hypothetical protein [Sulfurovum sp.]|uniref:hypothetical protein n=1 Tax=Sulfurovum sp. TaxID=1969726 RepID=UPI0035638F87